MLSLRRLFAGQSAAPLAREADDAAWYAAPATSVAKRCVDVVAASVLLTIAAPAMLAIAVAIRATSDGPIIFRQRRLGLGGRYFTVLKFRTMHHGTSEEPHRRYVTALIESGARSSGEGDLFKLHRDARVTGVGRWLRKASLDELPQLLNVLRGEMSLVGPRPPLAYEVAAYEPWQFERLGVRPGITGLWQTSGRNRLSYREMCELDISYIRTWSLSGDLRILLKTPWAMFGDRGGAA